ncbi:MAG: TIM barrel protein [Acidobacteria bacterium]|nr:TIM barrel protein [Acidobacteriota bacterium]
MATLSRRSFLGAAAALSLAPSLRAAARPRAIGFSLYGMKDWRLGDAMEVCGRLGYESIELCLLPGFPTDPENFAAPDRRQLSFQLRDLDLSLAGLMENLKLTDDDAQHAKNLERLRRAGELAHELVPADPVPVETVMGGKPEQWDELRESMAERLKDWAKVARELDFTIAIKPHVGSAAHLPEHALWLIDQVGSSHIRAAYDFSHYRAQGLDMAATVEALLPKTVFVHVKDVKPGADKVEFLLPGQGDIDYVQLFKLLAKGGYEGPVVVEVSSQIHRRPDYAPYDAAEESLEALLAAREQAEASKR